MAHDFVTLLISSQALVLHPEQSAGLSEEIQGMSSDSLLGDLNQLCMCLTPSASKKPVPMCFNSSARSCTFTI